MAKGYIFDLDGTVYLDEHLIDGAAEAIAGLRERGDKVVFLTNKSIATREDYVRKLNRLGIHADLEEVINSNYLAAKYLRLNMKPGESAYVIGEEPLFEELRAEGVNVAATGKGAAYVLLGWDRQFTYDKLCEAFKAVSGGAFVAATNPDRTCPVAGGEIPDCGAMIGALEGATGRPVDLVIGKPSSFAAELIVKEVLKQKPEDCFMVGDRLETDIRMGTENGLNTILVLTGISTPEMAAASEFEPTHILGSIKEIGGL